MDLSGNVVVPLACSKGKWPQQTKMEGEHILVKKFQQGKRIKSVLNFGFALQWGCVH